MTERLQIYRCEVCGNIVQVLIEGHGELVCCGEPMTLLSPKINENEGLEKHIPVYTAKPGCENAVAIHVTVGSTEHPMTEEHYVQWIYVQSEHGGQRKSLNPGDKPEAVFVFKNDKPIKIFEYCNLHGLYSCDIE